jgi:hypothetical protein
MAGVYTSIARKRVEQIKEGDFPTKSSSDQTTPPLSPTSLNSNPTSDDSVNKTSLLANSQTRKLANH